MNVNITQELSCVTMAIPSHKLLVCVHACLPLTLKLVHFQKH